MFWGIIQVSLLRQVVTSEKTVKELQGVGMKVVLVCHIVGLFHGRNFSPRIVGFGHFSENIFFAVRLATPPKEHISEHRVSDIRD